jgi:type I restriction-modification system DNA methylase subunit
VDKTILKEKLGELKLITDLYKSNKEQYENIDFDEMNTRKGFVDRFFALLDWDMDNSINKYDERNKEVVLEYRIKIKGNIKYPDYSFRIGGNTKFLLETKRPSITIKDDAESAFQIRNYGWHKFNENDEVVLCILTNFKEFAIYQTVMEPKVKDKADYARVFYCTYLEYEEKFEYIYELFSRKSIQQGSLNKYYKENTLEGKEKIDESILELINTWRKILAEEIYAHNKIEEIELNYTVQRLIDRIIFLRFGEDRQTEDFENLKEISEHKKVYISLLEYFNTSWGKYNSELFASDNIIDNLKIKDETIKALIEDLYYPKHPYLFNEIKIELLGSIYEQFLAETIRVLPSGKVKIEQKNKLRQGQGIYYTPQYIVEYIMKNTIDKLLNDLSFKKAQQIKVLDPACGSGSFLLAVYQHLMDYYLNWYKQENINKNIQENKIYEYKKSFKLTISQKREILLQHIFGVDIDKSAVEVTKLSLLLKLMEGENQESINNLFKYSHLQPLPNLKSNIKCGNSLVDKGFYNNEQISLWKENQKKEINVFNWEDNFKTIFDNGKFDCIVGNPPYGADLNKEVRSFLKNKYPFVSDYESYQYFIAKAKSLLNTNALFAFIIPNTMVLNLNAKNFRKFLINNFSLIKFNDLSEVDVFNDASVRTIIPVLINGSNENVICAKFDKDFNIVNEKKYLFEQFKDDIFWRTLSNSGTKKSQILDRILKDFLPLNTFLDVKQGYIPYRTTTLTKRHGAKKAKEIVEGRLWHSNTKKSKDYFKELQGADVSRYALCWSNIWVKYGEWVSTYLPINVFSGERILIREITTKLPYPLYCTIETNTFIHNPSVLVALPQKNNTLSLKYLLGILNSKLIGQLFIYCSPKAKKGLFPKVLITDVKNFPIKAININDKNEIKIYESIIKFVEDRMKLAINDEKNKIEISHIDDKIDELVYGLYNVTPDEVEIIKEATK